MVKARIGPVQATFRGIVSLVNLVPLESYGLVVEAKGGAAGFGKGEASVTLTEIPEGTLLGYGARGTVGGKLAQIGSRLVDGAVRKMANGFFAAFSERLGADPEAEEAPVGVAPAEESAAAAPNPSGRRIWWVAAGVLLIAAIVAILG